MALNREALTNTIEADLTARNANWESIESNLATIENTTIGAAVTAHNTSVTAHDDIRTQLSAIDAQLAEIANLKIKNLLLNNSFENGKTSWISDGPAGVGGGSLVNNEQKLHGANALRIINNNGVRHERQTIQTVVGHKYYYCASAYISSFTSGIVRTSFLPFDRTILNAWQKVELIEQAVATSRVIFVGSNSFSTYTAYFDRVMAIDLTAVFGAGKEPTIEKLNKIIDFVFNGYVSELEQVFSIKGLYDYYNENIKPLNEVNFGLMPIVTIATDDGWDTDYDLYKMMQKKGMRGTSFIVGTFVGGSANLNAIQIKEMADAGWEIASHTYNHVNLINESFPDGVIYQIFENKKYLENITNKKIETMAYPFGATNEEVRNIVRSFHEGARTSVTTGWNEFGDVANIYNMKTKWVDFSSWTVAVIKQEIDNLVNGRPSYLILSGHRLAQISGGGSKTLAEMEEVANYLKSYQMQGKLEVVTFAEGLRRIKSEPFYVNL